MPVYTLETLQRIPASRGEVWEFISSPANLKKITPGYMGFEVITQNLPDKMYPGMIITYKVSPLLGIKMTWVTEISQVRELEYFVDEQRTGPYRLWHHQHHIVAIEGGVLMKDIVTYVPPFGFLGGLVNALLIRNQLKEIFAFRSLKLNEIFGVFETGSLKVQPLRG
jgi:ligand-binding SRPBCC domain-containing protein